MTALALLLALTGPALAQVDPAQRRLIQAGVDLPSGGGPLGAYAFYYQNSPGALGPGTALRLVTAPVYLDSELAKTLGSQLDAGLGVAGGGFGFGHTEVRGGQFSREESFHGHGAAVAGSLYMLLNPEQRVPLSAVMRLSVQPAFFERREETAEGFVLPPDHTAFVTRWGLRLGGQEPLLEPTQAGELSGWYETRFRSRNGAYGFGGDRRLNGESHLFWLRSLLTYTFPKSGRRMHATLVGGSSSRADRLNAYRVGGLLPLASEFPLSIPGYYNQELTAKRFFLASGRYGIPIDEARRFGANVFGSGGWLDYLDPVGQPGAFNSGVGGSVDFESPWRVWRVELGYGYGIQARRGSGRGAHSISVLVQCDLEAQAFRERKQRRRRVRPDPPQGLEWLLHR